MTSRRASRRDGHRARPNRAQRHPHDLPEGDYGVQPAWCALDAIDEAKRLTHDQLIASMGETRTGPVYWRIAGDIPGAHALLDAFYDDDDPLTQADGNYIRQIRAHLREYGGTVVIAFAQGTRP